MNYKLFNLYLGTGKLKTILTFSAPFEITNSYYIDGFGLVLLFKNQHCIGLINESNKFIFPWAGEPNKNGLRDSTVPLFEYPSSVCYSALTKNLFVIENGGMRIRKIDLNPFYGSSVFGQAVQKRIAGFFTHFNNIGEIFTSCYIDKRGDIYWIVSDLNRCFKYSFGLSDFKVYIGDGKKGFSVSSDFCSSLVSSPSGIFCLGDTVYLSDSGNHCIREGKKIIAGCPNKHGDKDDLGIDAVLNFPSKIVYLKNMLCFMDKNKVKYYSLKDKKVGTLYTSFNLITIDASAKNLIIMEKL